MKKTLAMFLALAMVSALCGMLFVSAEDTNLAAGKSYTTTAIFTTDGVQNWPDEDGITLTDGIKAASDAGYADPSWVGFNKQSSDYDASEGGFGATTIIDLGASSDLSKIAFQAWGGDAGISVPYWMNLYVSADGETYTSAGYLEINTDAATAGVNAYEMDLDVTAQYVKICLYGYGWIFIDEFEIYGSAAVGNDETSDEPEDEPSVPSTETVEEVITIDGKLDDTGYTKATWFNKGVWQTIDTVDADGNVTTVAPVLKDNDIKYTTRTDADNIYLAIQVTDEVVLTTALDPEYKNDVSKFSQAGATNFRLWFLGDGMEKRTFYDLLWDGEKLVAFREKVDTEEIKFAFNTDGGVLTLELAIAKASLSITDSYKMMVTYSAPDFGEGEKIGYNAFHMTEFVRGEDGKLAEGWSGNDAMYVAYNDADVVLGSYEVDVDAPSTEPSEEPSEEPSDTPSESKPPKTGDAGILVFAVLGVVAFCGAAVAIKARG